MLRPFFDFAMKSPNRQLAFRRLVVVHTLLLTGLAYAVVSTPQADVRVAIGSMLLVLGIVEGAAMIGWRLTQLPKSPALEFLLTSPIQPRRLFVAECLVGVARFALVWLAGLPLLMLLYVIGGVDGGELLTLAVMPFVWGVFTGLALTTWIYEPILVRRLGELVALLGVLVYLVVGVVAGENLKLWLHALPTWLGEFLFNIVVFFHTMNPFGVVRYWLSPGRVDAVAWERFEWLHLFAVVAILLTGTRAAFRLRGHFHDRHYKPIDSSRASAASEIGERPLSWWAVRRVMEYSGRSNLWLAGGFSLIYAAYIAAGDHWPAWMGKLVFQLFEQWGGAPAVATALTVLAAVPAAFQYGLWDSSIQDRCRRLELLLLTELGSRDYWHASLSAAWKRGRGYFFGCVALWAALGVSGRCQWPDVAAAVVGSGTLWAFSFAVGFRGFATGNTSNSLATAMTLGLPLLLFALLKAGLGVVANFVPTALAYMPLRSGVSWAWLAGWLLTLGVTLALTRSGLRGCEADLRRWYDLNQGKR